MILDFAERMQIYCWCSFVLGCLGVLDGTLRISGIRSRPDKNATRSGMVVSVRRGPRVGRYESDESIATVEYKSDLGKVRRFEWQTDSDPTIGRSVLIRPKDDGSDEKVIAEPESSFAGGIGRTVVGACLIASSLLCLTAFRK